MKKNNSTNIAHEKLKNIKRNTVASSFDEPITLMKWIKKLHAETGEVIDALDAEITARENGDTALGGRIDAEVNRAELAESELQHDIDNHTSNSNIHVTATEKSTWNAKLSHAIVRGTFADNLATFYNDDGTVAVSFNTGGGGGGANWGSIGGTITNQTDLVNYINTAITPFNNHIADTTIHVTASEKSTWNGKQTALTTAQINACNSGITITKRSGYDTHVANSDIHVTATDKSNWNNKQTKLYRHRIVLEENVTMEIINTSNTLFTLDTLKTYLKGGSTTDKYYSACGSIQPTGEPRYYFATCIRYYQYSSTDTYVIGYIKVVSSIVGVNYADITTLVSDTVSEL